MSKQRRQGDPERHEPPSPGARPAADHPPGEPAWPGEHNGDVRHDRLDTIEWADDRTRAFNAHHGMDEGPIEDLLHGRETNASYLRDARQATPTLDPDEERADER